MSFPFLVDVDVIKMATVLFGPRSNHSLRMWQMTRGTKTIALPTGNFLRAWKFFARRSKNLPGKALDCPKGFWVSGKFFANPESISTVWKVLGLSKKVLALTGKFKQCVESCFCYYVARTIYAFFCSILARFTQFVRKFFVSWHLPTGNFLHFWPLQMTLLKLEWCDPCWLGYFIKVDAYVGKMKNMQHMQSMQNIQNVQI